LDEAVAFGGHGVGSLFQVCCKRLPMMDKISRFRWRASASGKKDTAYSKQYNQMSNKTVIRDSQAMNRCLEIFFRRSEIPRPDPSSCAVGASRTTFGASDEPI
jgi:hypothetical protein